MTDWPFGDIQPFRYGVILADPPWKYRLWSAAGEHKSPGRHYDCMEIEDIKALPVNNLASKDCLLFLWATFPMLPHAFDVLRAWGFRYVTGGVWHKTTSTGKTTFGTGYVLRTAAEPFLLGAIGSPDYRSKSERNFLTSERREHSRKPDETYELLERLCPKTFKLELFARRKRDGWDSWGNEVSDGQVKD